MKKKEFLTIHNCIRCVLDMKAIELAFRLIALSELVRVKRHIQRLICSDGFVYFNDYPKYNVNKNAYFHFQEFPHKTSSTLSTFNSLSHCVDCSFYIWRAQCILGDLLHKWLKHVFFIWVYFSIFKQHCPWMKHCFWKMSGESGFQLFHLNWLISNDLNL